jgi:hypothetical protein
MTQGVTMKLSQLFAVILLTVSLLLGACSTDTPDPRTPEQPVVDTTETSPGATPEPTENESVPDEPVEEPSQPDTAPSEPLPSQPTPVGPTMPETVPAFTGTWLGLVTHRGEAEFTVGENIEGEYNAVLKFIEDGTTIYFICLTEPQIYCSEYDPYTLERLNEAGITLKGTIEETTFSGVYTVPNIIMMFSFTR